MRVPHIAHGWRLVRPQNVVDPRDTPLGYRIYSSIWLHDEHPPHLTLTGYYPHGRRLGDIYRGPLEDLFQGEDGLVKAAALRRLQRIDE